MAQGIPFNLILISFSISVFIRGYVSLGFAAGTVAATGWPGWDWVTRSSFSNPVKAVTTSASHSLQLSRPALSRLRTAVAVATWNSFRLTRRWKLDRVRDHHLGYQHALRTHTIAAFNFLHHIFDWPLATLTDTGSPRITAERVFVPIDTQLGMENGNTN
jgi:hypothetical protein